MAKIYVSYNRNDAELVAAVVARLKQRGHEILIDTEILAAGGDWRRMMHEALKSADVFVVFVSAAAMQSAFVLSELGAARFRRETDGLLLLPVIVDAMDIPPVIQDVTAIQESTRNPQSIDDRIELLISRFSGRRADIQLFISHAHRDVDIAQQLVSAFEVGVDVPSDSISRAPGNRTAIPIAELAEKFAIDQTALYYRLEQLRYLGFLTRGGEKPEYTWGPSPAYKAELGIRSP